MKKEAPFNESEKRIWMSLSAIAGEFKKMEPTHPSDLQEAIDAIHTLQDILGRRVLRRTFPGSFASYRLTHSGWILSEE